jgi:uncharacterized protein (DUF433 family)
MDIRRTPLLTAREAARHLDMPESTLDAWIATRVRGGSMVHAVAPEKRGWPRMPFLAIIEAYVLRSLRDAGVPMDEIRRAADVVRREFHDDYALASQRIATDGVALFVELADRSLVHAKDDQLGIREVLADYLRFITWDDSGQPSRLQLRQYPEAARVVIDPRFGWGAPVLAQTKVPVDAIRDLWKSGGESIKVIAKEFDLTPDLVEDVLRIAA